MIKNKKEINRDISFDISETDTEHDATIAIGEDLTTLKGKMAIEYQKGSTTWGNQIQFVLYGKYCLKSKRAENTTGYNRIEIEIPESIGKELILNFAKRYLGLQQELFNPEDWNKVLCEWCGEQARCPKCNKFIWKKEDEC